MKIRTVTGDVPADKMGRTLTHEHLLYTYPGGEYDHQSAFRLDDAVSEHAVANGASGRMRASEVPELTLIRSSGFGVGGTYILWFGLAPQVPVFLRY